MPSGAIVPLKKASRLTSTDRCERDEGRARASCSRPASTSRVSRPSSSSRVSCSVRPAISSRSYARDAVWCWGATHSTRRTLTGITFRVSSIFGYPPPHIRGVAGTTECAPTDTKMGAGKEFDLREVYPVCQHATQVNSR